MKTLVLEKYMPKRGVTRPCARCGQPVEQPRIIHIRGWHHGDDVSLRKVGVPTEYGAGETGFIMAGHAADDAVAKNVTVRYRGKWTRREKHGPWSVNKAMRGE